MKIPKQMKKYCPHCKKVTTQKVTQFKTRPRPKTRKRGLKWGVRHQANIESGYGSFPKPKAAERKKTHTKATLMITCSECKHKHINKHPTRTKKFSQV